MKRTLLPPAALLAAFSLAGCHRYRRDLENICFAYERSGIPPGHDGPFASQSITAWLSAHIHTERAIALFREEAANPTSRRQFFAKLRSEAAAQGIPSCPLADLDEAEGTPTPGGKG